LLILAAAAAVVAAQTSPPAAPSQPAPSPYIGSKACKTCHPDIYSTFYRNPHYRLEAGTEPAEHAACENCHGPGRAHVEAHGGKTTIPNAFSLMKPEAVADTCLACHAKDVNRANIRRSQHTLNGFVCTTCHSIHRSPTPKFLLARLQRDLCYGCHADVRAQFQMPGKHRVNEGFMQCTDCHNPHGTPAPDWRMGSRPHMVQQALSNEEPCLKCHVDKRGPFTFEHPAVRVDGCEICHAPHGSTNPRLLRRPVIFTLCLECHNGLGNFGRTNTGDPLTPQSHNMLLARFRNCTTCHVRIHGSNADPFFLK